MDSRSPEKKTVLNCLKLIHQYSWLLNAFILDFYTEEHWERLPSSWKEVLSQCKLEELGEWMLYCDKPMQRVWPLSMLALRASAKALSLPREQHTLSKDTQESSKKVTSTSSVYSEKDIPPGVETRCLTHENLKQLFVKHVKPKKRHETVIMAKLSASAAIDSGVTCVVDVGGGKGHLSRLLAYGYGLRVCCVEAQPELVSSAREIDKQLKYTASKYLGNSYVHCLPDPQYIPMTVSCSGDALSQFRKEVFDKLGRSSGDGVSFGIVGLHPCGDLAATLLHLFSGLDEVKFLCIASCCYMKLSINRCNELQGYPLSCFLRSLPEEFTNLTYEALEVSCHALESYCQRLQTQQYDLLKIHSYRGVLEKLIIKYYPAMKHAGLRSVKHFNEMDFASYAKIALSRVSLSIPPSDFTSSETSKCLEGWQNVVAFYSLRLLLAPLVETTVILDRLLYVFEQGGTGLVIPGFDPILSPRNLILQGFKR